MRVEKWKTIKGYSGMVEVSNLGKVRNKKNKREYKQTLSCWGYPRVHLNLRGKNKNVVVHRLVASAFVENKNSFPQVNHIDGDKTNNDYLNLEWCTASQNSRHREEIIWNGEHRGGKKKRPVINLDTGEVFPSVKEATYKLFGRRTNDVGNAIRENRLCGGSRWGYVKENDGKV